MPDDLKKKQEKKLAELHCELAAHIEAGNEYYAAEVRDEITVAGSLARLIHKGE